MTIRFPLVLAAATLTAAAVITASPGAPQSTRTASALEGTGDGPGHVLYLVPVWTGLNSASDSDVAAQAALLRQTFPEGTGVKLGFTAYIELYLQNWDVDTTSQSALDAGLGTLTTQIDSLIAKCEANNLVLAISLVTAVRSAVDPVQSAAQNEDRRNMEWYSDNQMATGWVSYSRYARKQYDIFHAYLREAGRLIGQRIAAHPQTLVGLGGDGEIEMSYDRASDPGGPVIADYTPFAILEFRDWLTGRGLYNPDTNGPFAGQQYSGWQRYHNDPAPNVDAGDGATLDGDFGLNLTSWDLRYFNWSLNDPVMSGDPNAISTATYNSAGFNLLPDAGAGFFDAPRTIVPAGTSAWWDLWTLFRQTMVWHYNVDFAKSITGADTGTAGIPASYWYSYQIPADYLFGSTPSNPNPRLLTSASPWWTANIEPYGGLGFTAFGTNTNGSVFRTFPGFAAAIVGCDATHTAPMCVSAANGMAGTRWGTFEWNPVVPGETSETIYRDEMRLMRQYWPTLLAPFMWPGDGTTDVLNTGFAPALAEFLNEVKDGWVPSLGTDRTSLAFSEAIPSGGSTIVSNPQSVTITETGGGTVDWSIATGATWLTATMASGNGSASVSFAIAPSVAAALSAGTYTTTVTVSAPGSLEGAKTISVSFTLTRGAAPAPPFGYWDTPADGATGLVGSIAVTGWALDNIGIDHVELWRNCTQIDSAAGACAIAPDGSIKVYIGRTTIVAGARPDVEAAYPNVPSSNQAGFGYLLLTNLLPDLTKGTEQGGNGQFVLSTYAFNLAGAYTSLGTKTITVDNAHATIPFGAIDTPAQGATIPGASAPYDDANNYPMWGWAMTETGKCMNTSDLTAYKVYIDGVSEPVTSSNFIAGLTRSDLPAAFPGLCNSNDALAVYYFDASALGLSSGIHTVMWGITDDHGNTTNIGSRYFTLLASGGQRVLGAGLPALGTGPRDAIAEPPVRLGRASSLETWSATTRDVTASVNDGPSVTLTPDADGHFRLAMPAVGRISIDFGGPVTAGGEVAGSVVQPLPAGSHLDSKTGRFTWAPPVAFYGPFALRFVAGNETIPLDVQITDVAGRAPGVSMQIEAPAASATVPGSFGVSGWALDSRAPSGTGIAAIHVWAYRRDQPGAAPQFLGTATLGGARPDVAQAFGQTFARAGFSFDVNNLAPGIYDIVVYPWSSVSRTFEGAKVVRVVVP